jgi:hypothetical protein
MAGEAETPDAGRILAGGDGWDATAVLAARGARTHLTGAPER